MNILLVNPFALSSTGGVVTAVKMLCQEWTKQGHHVTLLVPGETSRVQSIGTMNGVSVYGGYLRVPIIRESLLRGLVSFCLFFPLTLVELHRFMARKQIHAVNIQYPWPWMFYFAVLRRISRWKLVVTLQGNDVHDLPIVSWDHRLFVRWLLKRADCVIGVSQSLLDKACSMFPGLKLHTSVVPNGAPIAASVNGSTVALKEGVPHDYVLTVGHIIYRKGMDLLIKALKVAQGRGSDLNLVIVGEGPEQENLLALARELGVAKRVYFAGNQPHERTLEFYRGCLFFVLSSRAEGLPLVIVEAMANRKAVVATRVDGVPEIVQDGTTGLLVEPEDPQSLAEALVTLYKDQGLRERFAQRGRERALQKFTWEVIAARYLSIFGAISDVRSGENRTSDLRRTA
jgi:glycosyltransferase involved in cell wall biosynthesis